MRRTHKSFPLPRRNTYRPARAAADDAKDSTTVKLSDVIDLGSIKGNVGDQNYTLSHDLDLSKYHTVSIWCKRFAVNFGAAPLKASKTVSQN
jgi:hypothetical protein